MKILVVGTFDPCGVAVGHAKLMRAAGHDYRIATANEDENYYGGPAVREFARDADVIQFCPGIGNGGGWSIDATAPFGMDYLPYELLDESSARRVAYFHGSVATWTHREKYAAFYGGRGWRLATSTLDYATELPATYLPPFVAGLPLASLREPGQPFVIAHTPTNPANCHTAEFLGLMQRMRWAKKLPPTIEFVSGKPHAEALAAKARSHACFDHLRGSFSVNTLEACAMGLVPLVGVKSAYLRGQPWLAPQPHIEDFEALRTVVGLLADDVGLTREWQQSARRWFEKHFSAEAVTKRLLDFYEGL